MKKIILAVPKGRISNELIPLLETMNIKIENDFFDSNTRKLYFKTNHNNFEIIRVRSFDVATFVAFGAAQIGVAGNDILKEFQYNEIYSILDLKIGKCRLSVAKKKDEINQIDDQKGHILVATKYKETVIDHFAEKGIRAECIKLNGAIELAPKLGICSTIVDLVSTGNTLKENNLVETEVLLNITSRLIVNKIAYKVMNSNITNWVKRFERAINE
ncbi:MAG: ATP phosphoribosyltransferase [Rickettsiales bacterium]|nr:ATP phosphoribosyltransferase [Rickettsiales bacterium]